MFKQLQIKNFQSHKNSILEFHPGVNIIIGQTDTGKTAIVRCLKWINFNRPTGEAFKSNWGGQTSVLLETDDHTIERIKGTKNLYKLDNVDMTAFGTDVPQEIIEAVNMSETNYQFQHDNFFLLSNTAGEVAQFFNKIAHLDKIDKGVQFLKSAIRVQTNRVKTNKEIISNKKKEYLKYKQLLKKETELEAVEEDMSGLRRKQNVVKNLSKLLTNLQECNQKLKRLRKWQEIAPAVDKNINRLSDIAKLNDDKKSLLNLLIKIQNTKTDLEELAIVIKLKPAVDKCIDKTKKQKLIVQNKDRLLLLLDKIEALQEELAGKEILIKQEKPVVSLLRNINTLNKNKRQVSEIQAKLTAYQQTTQKKRKLENKLAALEKEFHDNFPEICPLCGK